ncbi:MAG: S9 family peptidase [Planctomycetes bacterium]|nr:S9 family peptidase [Planctomycetota bacterium]
MPTATPTRARHFWTLAVALALAAQGACRAIDGPSASPRRPPATAPSLEEIFLLPGLQGRAPRFEHLSADGRWVFFRHDRMEVAPDGTRKLAEQSSLRVLCTEAPGLSDLAGVPVADFLPPRLAANGNSGAAPASNGQSATAESGGAESKAAEEKPPSAPQFAHSHFGARLLARRGKELFLLDAPEDVRGAWRATLLLAPVGDGALGSLADPRFSEQDDAVLVESAGDLWRFPLAGLEARQGSLSGAPQAPLWTRDDGENLTSALEPPVDKLTFSRDLRVVYGRDPALGQIEVPATDESAAVQRPAQILWRDSGERVELEGLAALTSVEGAQLSPDGRFLFASTVLRANDPAPTLIPDYLAPRVTTRRGRSDLAEDGPAPRTLHLWDTRTGARVELSTGPGDSFWLRTTGWAPEPLPDSPAKLVLGRLSLDFRTLETFVWTEAAGLEPLMVDRDARWIGGPVDRARWTSDGKRLVFGSESFPGSTTPGRAQLFSVEVPGGEVRQLTRVSGEVETFDVGRDGTIAFCFNTAERPDRFEAAWISPDGRIHAIEAPAGSNMDAQVADTGSRVVFMHSRLFTPAELWTAPLVELPGAPAGVATALTRVAPREFLERDWIRPLRLTTRGPLGAAVHSHVFLPRATSLDHPDRPRPLVVFIHGAGYLQNVTDSMTEYEPNLMFHSRLAELGYVVLDVDYRGSAGYGGAFRTDVQFRLGELELQDIASAVDELARRRVVDEKRVGCYGGSYGGFLTLMALFTQGERWTAGAALRSVTDWRTYHPGYTQPRLGRPSTHAESYARSSPIDHAHKLTKPLLLLHGMMDSNVFAQDTIRLMETLIDQGKEFEVMLYPSQDHAFTDGAHWLDQYKRIERFLTEHLGAP